MISDILQPTHIIFLLVVALLVLGPKRLPEAGKALGKGIRSFRGAMDGIQDEASNMFKDEPSGTPDPVVIEADESSSVAEAEPVDSSSEGAEAVAPATVIEPTLISSTSRASQG